MLEFDDEFESLLDEEFDDELLEELLLEFEFEFEFEEELELLFEDELLEEFELEFELELELEFEFEFELLLDPSSESPDVWKVGLPNSFTAQLVLRSSSSAKAGCALAAAKIASERNLVVFFMHILLAKGPLACGHP